MHELHLFFATATREIAIRFSKKGKYPVQVIFFKRIKLTKHNFVMVGMCGVISFPHLYTIFSQACKQCSLSSSSSTWAYFKTKGTTRSTWSPKRCPAWRQTAPKLREIRWNPFYIQEKEEKVGNSKFSVISPLLLT